MVQTKVIDALTDTNVPVYVVWTPVLHEDNRQAAAATAHLIPDESAAHFWDADKSLGLALGKTVSLPRRRKLAWDVYFVFSRDAYWGDTPPVPADWMHQLGNDDRTLDGDKLRAAVQKLQTSKREN